jgi:hypothetical protein
MRDGWWGGHMLAEEKKQERQKIRESSLTAAMLKGVRNKCPDLV